MSLSFVFVFLSSIFVFIVKGLVVFWLFLFEIIFVFFFVFFKRFIDGGFINIIYGLNFSVFKCFIVCKKENKFFYVFLLCYE